RLCHCAISTVFVSQPLRGVLLVLVVVLLSCFFFFFQAEDGIRDRNVTGVQTCALPIYFRTTDGDNAKGNTEAGAAQPCGECFFEFCPGQTRACDFAVAQFRDWLALFVDDVEDFAQCEDADGDNNDADAVEHFWNPTGKALGAGDFIDAYCRDEQTNDQGNQAAKQGVRDDRCRGQEGEDCQGEV